MAKTGRNEKFRQNVDNVENVDKILKTLIFPPFSAISLWKTWKITFYKFLHKITFLNILYNPSYWTDLP